MRYTCFIFTLLFGLSLALSGCLSKSHGGGHDHLFRHWAEIKASDTLRIGTTTSPSAFFIYRGEEIGYEYSKVLQLAQGLHLTLDVHLSNSIDTLRRWLDRGEIDLCITPIAMTRENLENYTFCGEVDTTALVLVQHRSMTPIRSVLGLRGDTITVISGTAEELRLEQIDTEIGPAKDFVINREDTVGVEDLMSQVGNGELSYTIADERLASAFALYHKDVDVRTRVSVPIRYSWVVDKGNNRLKAIVDSFFMAKKIKVCTIEEVYAKYFDHYRWSSALPNRMPPGVISPYDKIFKTAAPHLGWEWTMLAAIAYQESRFRPSVVGWSGAMGLMGIMPRTGRVFGASREQLLDPVVSVRVAVDCLLSFGKSFSKIKDPYDRRCFTLAAYNAGVGHIQDACRLAEKYGYSPTKWHGNVQKFLLLKCSPEYYNDPVCKFGFLRGQETVRYVRDIMNRNESYEAHIQSVREKRKK